MNVLVMAQSLLEARAALARLEAARKRGPSDEMDAINKQLWLQALEAAIWASQRHELICRAGLTLTVAANDQRFGGPRAA